MVIAGKTTSSAWIHWLVKENENTINIEIGFDFIFFLIKIEKFSHIPDFTATKSANSSVVQKAVHTNQMWNEGYELPQTEFYKHKIEIKMRHNVAAGLHKMLTLIGEQSYPGNMIWKRREL